MGLLDWPSCQVANSDVSVYEATCSRSVVSAQVSVLDTEGKQKASGSGIDSASATKA